MAQLFGHEKLAVYQGALQLVSWLEGVSSEFACSADLLSKIDKSTTSIVLNVAEGNGRFTGTDQTRFLGIAYKATVQSASLVDLATVNGSEDHSRIEEGRRLLRQIAAMLTSLAEVAGHDT